MYVKGDFTPSQIRWSDNYNPQTPCEPYRGYYANITRPRRSVWDGPETTPINASLGSANSRRYNNTPLHGLSSTSQYYNPLETDSYLPSYDHDNANHHYCFASPLYSTVWSPPSGRKSASRTPLFGSIRKITEGEDTFVPRRHVYLPTSVYESGRDSTRSLDDCSQSPQTPHVYATPTSSSSSTRDPEIYSPSPMEHVYASACDNSLSPTQQYSGESSRSLDMDPEETSQDCSQSETKNGLNC